MLFFEAGELLTCKHALPPSMGMGAVRTTGSGVVKPEEAMKLLRQGNQRFCNGTAVSGLVDQTSRGASFCTKIYTMFRIYHLCIRVYV